MRAVKYSVANNSIGNAGWHYLKVGKETQQKYFSGVHNKTEGNLGFGNNTELLTGRGYVLEPAQLLVGTIDLHTERPVQVSVIMCDEKTDLDLYNEYAPVQPMDEHPLRGTFERRRTGIILYLHRLIPITTKYICLNWHLKSRALRAARTAQQGKML